jgi:hypothetical protein
VLFHSGLDFCCCDFCNSFLSLFSKKPKPDAMKTTHISQNLKDMHAHEICKFRIDLAAPISATLFFPFFSPKQMHENIDEILDVCL